MNHSGSALSRPLVQDLLTSLLLLSISAAGGWLAYRITHTAGSDAVPLRLLMILLVHPFAMAAWIFCGLPGLGLAVKSLGEALDQRKVLAGIASLGLMVFSLACATLWL